MCFKSFGKIIFLLNLEFKIAEGLKKKPQSNLTKNGKISNMSMNTHNKTLKLK